MHRGTTALSARDRGGSDRDPQSPRPPASRLGRTARTQRDAGQCGREFPDRVAPARTKRGHPRPWAGRLGCWATRRLCSVDRATKERPLRVGRVSDIATVAGGGKRTNAVPHQDMRAVNWGVAFGLVVRSDALRQDGAARVCVTALSLGPPNYSEGSAMPARSNLAPRRVVTGGFSGRSTAATSASTSSLPARVRSTECTPISAGT
jgi:hypothetical protein